MTLTKDQLTDSIQKQVDLPIALALFAQELYN
jgi:hypothetical protein